MRNYKRDLLTILLAAYGVGFIAEAAYAGVVFIGDGDKIGFGAAKKLLPTVFDCPDGQAWYKGRCEKKCDRTAFSLTGTPDEVKGTFATCTDAWGTYYTYTSCHNGWDLIEGNCTETDCTGFPYTSQPESIAGTVTSCKSGLNTFYKYLSCHEGWDFSNGKCTVHTCSSTTYPYNSKPSSDAGTVISCKTGAATQYGYSECRTGWDKSNGYCNIHVCDSNAFPFTSQPSSSIGTVSSCKTGNDVKYGYSACTPEYELKNGQCEIKCSYTATSKPTGCRMATDSCKKNGKTYYASTCASCNSGYTLKSGTCKANTCSGYNSTTPSIANCTTTASCTKPNGMVYMCSTCKSGYAVYGGQCFLARQLFYDGSRVIAVSIGSGVAADIHDGALTEWETAQSACAKKTTGGHHWRLPTQAELIASNSIKNNINATLRSLHSQGYYLDSYSTYLWTSDECTAYGNTLGHLDSIFSDLCSGSTSSSHYRCVFDY